MTERLHAFIRFLRFASIMHQKEKQPQNEGGQGYGKLLQLYGVHKATLEARKQALGVVGKKV